MHARVVGWAPVPNARPGSTTTEVSPGGDRLPGWPDPQASDAHGPMERTPALLPAREDGLRCHLVGERGAYPLGSGLVRVDGELGHATGGGALLESARSELQEAAAGELGVRGGHAERDSEEIRSSAQRALQPAEEALILVVRLIGLRPRLLPEVFEEPSLLFGQFRRKRDIEPDVEVAAA